MNCLCVDRQLCDVSLPEECGVCVCVLCACRVCVCALGLRGVQVFVLVE